MSFSPQDFAHCKVITSAPDAAATDVQTPLVLLGDDFPVGAAAGGADLRFWNAAGTAAVPYWIQQFDPAGKTAIIWIRPAVIPAAGDNALKMYWGNVAAGAASSYDAVFEKLPAAGASLLLHFDEGAGMPVDSSAAACVVTPSGPPTWGTGDGGVNGLDLATQFAAGSFRQYAAGQGDSVAGVLDTFPPAGSLSLWLRNDSGDAPNPLVQKVNAAGESLALIRGAYNSGFATLTFRIVHGGVAFDAAATPFATCAAGTWQHVVCTWGPGGMSLWVDGVRYGYNASTAVPDAVSEGATSLTIGDCGDSGGASFQFSVDELAIYPFEAQHFQVQAWHHRRKPLAVSTQWDKLQRLTGPIIGYADGVTGPLGACQEPKVVKHPTLDELWMYYTSGGLSNWGSVIRRATSTDGVMWVDQGVAVAPRPDAGDGVFVGHHRVVIHAGTWYMFYDDESTMGYQLKVSDDGITWTDGRTVQEGDWFADPDFWGVPVGWPYPVIVPNSWAQYGAPGAQAQPFPDGFGNTWATAEYGRWQVLIEAGDPNRNGAWSIGYFESPLFSDTLTPAQAAYQLQLVAGPFGGSLSHGVEGGPFAIKIGDRWHLWYHLGAYGSLPTNIAHAVSADLRSWAADPLNPVLAINGTDITNPQDQVADPTVVEWHGKVWVYFSANSNSVGGSNLLVATYDGTLAQLVGDDVYWTPAHPTSPASPQWIALLGVGI